MLRLCQVAELLTKVLRREFITKLVDGFDKFVLHSNVGSVTCTTVILQGDNTLGNLASTVTFNLLGLFLGEIGIVSRIAKEFLDFVFEHADVYGFATGEKSVSRIDSDNDDVTTVDLDIFHLLIFVRHRRETSVQTCLASHGCSHKEVAQEQERDISR